MPVQTRSHTPRVLSRHALWLGLASLALLCGCRLGSKVDVAVTGAAVEPGTPTAVDVNNWNGSVRVLTGSRYKQAEVRAKVRRTQSGSPGRRDIAKASSITAETTVSDGRAILVVRSTTTLADPQEGKAELTICLPACAGVLVRNAGGIVDLRGVGGAVTVENGFNGGPGGRVELRTDEPMTQPVALVTSDGPVHYQVGPSSTGRFDLQADDGMVEFLAKGGSVRTEVVDPDRWIGTLNDGENPVVLRSGRGTVGAMVIPDARAYRPSRWKGLFFWKTRALD